jgi:BolA family transcriptional regulator, general stress-responsive regulator
MEANEEILKIKEKLINFDPNNKYLKVIDQSAMHSEHLDTKKQVTHLKIIMVSDKFIGTSRVDRSKMIHNLLKDDFDDGLHALSLDLKDKL